MASRSYGEFSASQRSVPGGTYQLVGEVPANERIEISIYLKPRDSATAAIGSRLSRADLRARRAAQHARDFELIRVFAQENGLSVLAEDPARRLARLAGTAAQLQTAFRTRLSHYRSGQRTIRARSGSLSLPSELLPVVESVLGLDTRPVARPRVVLRPGAATGAAHLPNQVASLYGFPTTVTGKGQCVALIELGGGFQSSDTAAAFKAMGIPPPAVAAIPVDGGSNQPVPDDGADAEVALDIQVVGGAAPGARIAVYFAPNTDAGFVDAITAAVHDTSNAPAVISISWGSAESEWTSQSIQTMDSALQDASTVGVSVFAAAGDSLATDGVADGKAHVDFPASSPWVVGCGGTKITVSGGSITAEVVWNDGNSGTGGGISDLFAEPSFQQHVTLPPNVNDGKRGSRGVPDVAADASPETGYRLVVGGKAAVVGGTSAVAPLWAGLTALINEGVGKPVGFLLPFLYANPSLLRQITQGNNMAGAGSIGYEASQGWNACTGLGVPRGEALLEGLRSPTR